MSQFEKAVKGGTKVKCAPPKSKYVETVLQATHSGEAGVAEVFRTLTNRLRDSTWTVAFKSLILVHLMIKEGVLDVTLSFVAAAPRNRLAINTFTDVQTQGHNIRRYSEYLLVRAQSYAATRCDYVRTGDMRMKRMTVDKGLLRETSIIQDQVRALIKCDLFSSDVENEISLTAFRLLTRDLLDLYHVENEAVMNVLSHYFELSKPDAERAIKIYKRFCTQTDQVVEYLNLARQYEYATKLEIPRIKHAPTSLANSLQEYLDDKDFETNRRQYLAEQEAKNGPKLFKKSSQAQLQKTSAPAASTPTAPTSAAPAKQAESNASKPAKGPAPDLIDFFSSIEQSQQPTNQANSGFEQQSDFGFAQQQPQPTGFQQGFQQMPPQSSSGFGMDSNNLFGQPQQQQQQQQMPIQSQPTGFGGYAGQPQQQQQNGFNFFDGQQQQNLAGGSQAQPTGQLQPQQQQQQATNPFRASMMPTGNSPSAAPMPQHQSTNPFARGGSTSPMPGNAFAQQQQQQQQQPPPLPQQPPPLLQPQQTGTNPFARPPTATLSPPPAVPPLQMQPTGSTNPFRQSMFVNQQTGQGWQQNPMPTMGGLEKWDTVPVFPRPGGGDQVSQGQAMAPQQTGMQQGMQQGMQTGGQQPQQGFWG